MPPFCCALPLPGRRRRIGTGGWWVTAPWAFTLAADWFLLVAGPVVSWRACAPFCVVQVLYLARIHRLLGEGCGGTLLLRGLLVPGGGGALVALGLWEPLTAVSALNFIQLAVKRPGEASAGTPVAGFGAWGSGYSSAATSAWPAQPVRLFAWAGTGRDSLPLPGWACGCFYLPSQVLIASSVAKGRIDHGGPSKLACGFVYCGPWLWAVLCGSIARAGSVPPFYYGFRLTPWSLPQKNRMVP